MTAQRLQQRTWRFPRPLVESYVAFTGLIWVGFVVVVIAIAVGIEVFRTVTGSVWEVAIEFIPWYVGFFGGYAAFYILPMFVAHGRTRRDTAIELAIFNAVFAAAAALMVTVGFLIEYVVFGIAGWPRELSENRLFDSHGDVAVIFTEHVLTLLVYTATGGFIGAAFYRYKSDGWLSLFPASILVGLVGVFTRETWGPVGWVFDRYLPTSASLPLAIVTSLACVVAALAMTWPIVRNVPLRNK